MASFRPRLATYGLYPIKRMKRVVVIGAGIAGLSAAVELRAAHYAGSITIISNESFESGYNRCALSEPVFLVDDLPTSGIRLALPAIEARWITGESVVSVDTEDSAVYLGSGLSVPYDGLVIACGARARSVGDYSAGSLTGILSLRTLEDAITLRHILKRRPAQLLVVGGGLIGSEVASSARKLGIPVTIVDSGATPMASAFGLPISEYLLARHASAGIKLRLERRVVGLITRGKQCVGVTLDDGSSIYADAVLTALGASPNADWLNASGLAVGDGLLCASDLHVLGHTNIVGAGDVVRWWRSDLRASVRVEHWANAHSQGVHAARSLLAGPGHRPFEELPNFGSTIHGARVRAIGFPELASGSTLLEKPHQERLLVALSRAGRLVGVAGTNSGSDVLSFAPHVRRHSAMTELR